MPVVIANKVNDRERDMFNIIKKMIKTGIVTTVDPIKPPPATSRGKINVHTDLCQGCKQCIDICPAQAIQYVEIDKESFATLTLDYTKCILCGLCVEHCPSGALYQENICKLATRTKENLIETFHIRKHKEDIAHKSSGDLSSEK